MSDEKPNFSESSLANPAGTFLRQLMSHHSHGLVRPKPFQVSAEAPYQPTSVTTLGGPVGYLYNVDKLQVVEIFLEWETCLSVAGLVVSCKDRLLVKVSKR